MGNHKAIFLAVWVAVGLMPQLPLAAGDDAMLPDGVTGPSNPDKRWLNGLYLDQPEEMDDPYRFFRW